MSLIFKLVSRYNWLHLKYIIPIKPVVLELFFSLLRCTYPMWLINQSSKVDLSIYRSYPSHNKIKSLNKIPYTYCRYSKRTKSWKIIRLVVFFWQVNSQCMNLFLTLQIWSYVKICSVFVFFCCTLSKILYVLGNESRTFRVAIIFCIEHRQIIFRS